MFYRSGKGALTPKPLEVIRDVGDCIEGYAVNPLRGTNSLVRKANSVINACREAFSKEFSVSPSQIAFVPAATYALNFVLKGYAFRPGATVYSSGFEHNAVARCLYSLEQSQRIRWRKTPINRSMELDEPQLIRKFQIHHRCRADRWYAYSIVTGH